MASEQLESPAKESSGKTATVLIVEDEDSIRSLYAAWLEESYTVETAATVATARDQLGTDVDIVLLDRNLPDGTGRKVLTDLRDRDLDCRVVMVTGTEPDLDVADMAFDEYLTKPIEPEDLRANVEAMLARTTYDDLVQEYFALASKRASLKDSLGNDAENHEEYLTVERRIAELEGELEQPLADLDETSDELFEGVYHDLDETSSL